MGVQVFFKIRDVVFDNEVGAKVGIFFFYFLSHSFGQFPHLQQLIGWQVENAGDMAFRSQRNDLERNQCPWASNSK